MGVLGTGHSEEPNSSSFSPGNDEGLLESGLVGTSLFGLSLKFFFTREENLVHLIGDSLEHLGDVVPPVLLQQTTHCVHVH